MKRKRGVRRKEEEEEEESGLDPPLHFRARFATAHGHGPLNGCRVPEEIVHEYV
jgi:hypothetical protein